MNRVIKIILPIFIILLFALIIILGISSSTYAYADSVSVVNEKVNAELFNNKLGSLSLTEEQKLSYFIAYDFNCFYIGDVDKSGIFALTYYIEPASCDSLYYPAGKEVSVPLTPFKFCVSEYPKYVDSCAYVYCGDSERYNGNWDLGENQITYTTDTVVQTAGFYTFYFTIPQNWTNNYIVISASYRLYDVAHVYGYQVERESKVKTPALNVVSSAHNFGYTDGVQAGYDNGYADGVVHGEQNSENYINGYNSGNEIGYNNGYNVGYTEGLSSASSLDGTGLGALGGTISATVNTIIKSLDVVGNVNIFGVTVWSLIALAVAIAIVTFIIRLVKR